MLRASLCTLRRNIHGTKPKQSRARTCKDYIFIYIYTRTHTNTYIETNTYKCREKQLSMGSLQSPDCGGLFFDPKDYFPCFAAPRTAIRPEIASRIEKRGNVRHVSSFVIGILLTPRVYRGTLVRARGGVYDIRARSGKKSF